MQNFKMAGIELAFVKQLKENTTNRPGMVEVIEEWVDNSVDAIRRQRKVHGPDYIGEIHIELDERSNKITCTDNGDGMVGKIKKIFSRYESQTNHEKGSIGLRNMGLKNSIIRISNYFQPTGSVLTIDTCNKLGKEKLLWVLHNEFPLENVSIEDYSDWDEHETGSKISLNNPDSIVFGKGFSTLLRKELSTAYAYICLSENIHIFVNGNEISTTNDFGYEYIVDNDMLGCRDGLKVFDACVFKPTKFEFVRRRDNAKIKGRIIPMYLGMCETYGTKPKSDRNYTQQPISILYGGRCISNKAACGDFFKVPINRGGAYGIRFLFQIDEDKNDALKINSRKSMGIIRFCENENLFTDDMESDGENIFCWWNKSNEIWESAYDMLDREYRMLGRVNDWRSDTDGKEHEKYLACLSDDDLLKSEMVKLYAKKLRVSKNGKSVVSDDFALVERPVPFDDVHWHKLDSTEDIISACERIEEFNEKYGVSLAYTIVNILRSRHMHPKNALKVLNEIINTELKEHDEI